jgi:hypothetical protein
MLRLAPADAMQFGRALPRVLQGIFDANTRFGPVFLIKVDIVDGFYRISINPAGIPKLGVVFPTEPGAEAMVAFPFRLPMGWSTRLPTSVPPPRLLLTWPTPVSTGVRRHTATPHRLNADADVADPTRP